MKELTEFIDGILEASLLMTKHFKDGAQMHDAIAIFADLQSDQALREKLVEAAKGMSKIPTEIKELGFSDSLDLTILVMHKISKIIASVQES